MKRGMIALLAALSMAALVAGGCANKEVVKAEEPVVAPVTKVEPAKPEPVKPVSLVVPRLHHAPVSTAEAHKMLTIRAEIVETRSNSRSSRPSSRLARRRSDSQ